MAHFLDRLVGHKFEDGLLYGDFIPELARAECIIADNVYRYFFEKSEYYRDMGIVDGQEKSEVEVGELFGTLPALVPPFASTFVTSADYGGKFVKQGGVLLIRRPILDTQHASFRMALEKSTAWQSRLALHRSGVRWLVYAIPFLDLGHALFPPMVACLFPVMEDGHSFYKKDDPRTYSFVVPDTKHIARLAKDKQDFAEIVGGHHDLFGFWVLPALLALSLIHCRNIQIVEHNPARTRAQRRQSERRQEKTGHGLIRFYTLQIEAVKRVLHEEGRINEVGLAQALHICRGHFKDYREGKGLFGKLHDVYWWNEHERGDLSEGAILKDYQAPPVTRETVSI